jgi:hypothetical protein
LAAEAGAVFVVAFLVFLEKFTGINFFFTMVFVLKAVFYFAFLGLLLIYST